LHHASRNPAVVKSDDCVYTTICTVFCKIEPPQKLSAYGSNAKQLLVTYLKDCSKLR
jgi:hypothetical protein